MLHFKPEPRDKYNKDGTYTDEYNAYKSAWMTTLRVNPNTGELIVKGDTYPVKEQLKAAGFKWNRIPQEWTILPADAQGVIDAMKMLNELPVNIQVDEFLNRFQEQI